jgi:beta-catenin-like protein 1
VSWRFLCVRFIDSEADLDVAIKALLPLAQDPALAYPELVKSGAVSRLIGLLSHENVDIVIDIVEVIHELTDEDVGNEDGEDGEKEKNADALKVLIEGLVRHCCTGLSCFADALRSWRTPYWSFWSTI